MRRIWFFLIALWAMGFVCVAQAQPMVTQRQVQLSLVADRDSVAPGEHFTLGLRQIIVPGWHVYWLNPGDAGLPLEMDWVLPEGFTVGAFAWPTPKTFTTVAADLRLVNYVYENEVLLPLPARAPPDARPGDTLTVSAIAYYLVCDDSTCVPEEGEVSLTLPVTAQGAPGGWGPAIAEAQAGVPQAWDGVEARLDAAGRLSAAGGELARLAAAGQIRDLHFFPVSQTSLDHNIPQAPRLGPQGVSFTLHPPYGAEQVAAPLEGVIGFEMQTGEGWVRRGLLVTALAGPLLPGTADAALQSGAAAETGVASSTGIGLIAALAFAFLGGLILNLMPCVLPILSVKALSLVHGAQAGRARRHGVLFFVGVMATFLALAGVLIALRAGGGAVGWGFQLQEPWFMGALAALFFAIGLNLMGVFEIGGDAQSLGAGLADRGGDAGAFFTGLLAVVAATPCTAPFMASAVGFAAAQPAPAALAVFAALGVGFAAPFTILSFAPGFARWLPKPGPWMERFKQALAFPMFATAAWAAWVVSAQAGADGLLLVLAVGIAIALIAWGFRTFRGLRGRAAVTAAAVLTLLAAAPPPAIPKEPWSPERVAALQAEGRTVFVNFTADWCVTCKVNERVALSSPAFVRALGAIDAVYLVADWTDRDPAIAQTLAQYGRDGVPLYLVHRPGETEPVILPQVLTPQTVAEALKPS